jgi:hypothetical protein
MKLPSSVFYLAASLFVALTFTFTSASTNVLAQETDTEIETETPFTTPITTTTEHPSEKPEEAYGYDGASFDSGTVELTTFKRRPLIKIGMGDAPKRPASQLEEALEPPARFRMLSTVLLKDNQARTA